MMKKYKILLFLSVIITCYSCSEGDLFNDTVNFEAPLEKCFNANDFVFYKTDGTTSLSVNFTSTTFDINDADEAETISIALDGSSNILSYRVFDSAINGFDYFCSSVPPNGIEVLDELTSTSGTVEISYSATSTDDSKTTYSRTVTLRDITLTGSERAIRKEVLILGSDEVTVTN